MSTHDQTQDQGHDGDLRELGLDQGLIDRLGRLADPVFNLGGLECLQDFQQCRLVQGHRVLSFRENHWRGLADHHTVALLTPPDGTPPTRSSQRQAMPPVRSTGCASDPRDQTRP
jgi:hypothetical protein